jgi:UDP-2-acetamido-2,6-beta-L-arabino-hexul-4-ose reductase
VSQHGGNNQRPDDPASAVVRVEPVNVHRDARGWVFEPIGPSEFASQRNAHLVLSEPGAVRGNHYHVRGTEVMVVVGPSLVRYREPDGRVVDLEVGASEMVRLTIPPGRAHAVQNTGSSATVSIAFNTEAHDPASPDVVRDVLIG